MMKKLMLLAAISAIPLTAVAARAAVIYDGGAPNRAFFVVAEGSYSIIQAAQAFTLAAGANTIGGVNWWGICGQGACPTGDFAISFYNDFGGAPGTIIGLSQRVGNANQTATGNEIDDTHPEYAYSASIVPVTLTP